MRPVLMVVVHVLGHKSLEMPFIQNDDMVQQISSATSHPAFSDAICHGLRNAVRIGRLPISLAADAASLLNFESRSSNRNLCATAYGHASRICCTIQKAQGFRATLTPQNLSSVMADYKEAVKNTKA